MSSVYQIVTDTIVKQLEEAIASNKKLTWMPTWSGEYGLAPMSTSTGKRYSLLNELMLRFAAIGGDYRSRWWTTIKRANEMGAKVKPGSKSALVTFWGKTQPKPDPNKRPGEISSRDLDEHWFLRYYRVFNFDQLEWSSEEARAKAALKFPDAEHEERKPFAPIAAAEAFVAGLPEPPRIEVGRPAYSPQIDVVTMPDGGDFETPDAYYSTLMHELTHWTGAKHRLNRRGIVDPTKRGSEKYALEELVAELGSAFAVADIGLEPDGMTTAYLQGWLTKLKSDTRMIVTAASQAERAVRWMKGQAKPDQIPAAPAEEERAA